MNQYKNISIQDLSIPGIGIVKAGEIISTKLVINNANFKKVEAKSSDVEEGNNKVKA